MKNISTFIEDKLFENYFLNSNLKPSLIKEYAKFNLSRIIACFNDEKGKVYKAEKYIDKVVKFQTAKNSKEILNYYMDISLKGSLGKKYFIRCTIDATENGSPNDENVHTIYGLYKNTDKKNSLALYAFALTVDRFNECASDEEFVSLSELLKPSWNTDDAKKFVETLTQLK